jgi:hypothetical protein
MASTIKLLYSQNNWDILNEMARENKAKNIRMYIHGQLYRLQDKILLLENQNEINIIKRENIFFIPPEICSEINEFSKIHGIMVPRLIRMLFTDSLLNEHYKNKLGL